MDEYKDLNKEEFDEDKKKRLKDYLEKKAPSVGSRFDQSQNGKYKFAPDNMTLDQIAAAKDFLTYDDKHQKVGNNILGKLRDEAGVDPVQAEQSADAIRDTVPADADSRPGEQAARDILSSSFQKPVKNKEMKRARALQSVEAPMDEQPAPAPTPVGPSPEQIAAQQYGSASQAANGNQLIANSLRAGNAINAGLNLTPVSNANAEALEKSANAPTEQLKEQKKLMSDQNKLASEKMDLKDEAALSDPNSDISKTSREALKKFGVNLPDNVSASVLKKSGVNIGTLLGIKEKQKERELLGASLRDEKHGKEVDKLGKALQADLEPDKNRTGNFGTISSKFLTAERLQTLAQDFNGNPINLNAQQMEELGVGLAGLLSSGNVGAVAESRVKALVPTSIWGDSKAIGQWISNKPTGNDQQAFVQNMLDTVDREKKLSSRQLKDIQKRRLASHRRLKDLDSEAYNEILQSYGLEDSEKHPEVSKKSSGHRSTQSDKSEPRVTVVAPDGKRGTLPLSQVKQALAHGYTMAPHEPPEGM